MVEKNLKNISDHARLLGNSEYILYRMGRHGNISELEL